MHGKVTDLLTGKGIPGAVVDIWQASSNGKYDFQDPENQSDNNLRGKFKCDENGEYNFYCLKPTAYLETDTVFAVKDDLVVDFKPRHGDPKAELDLEYNIILAPKSFEGVTSTSQTTIGLEEHARL